MDDFKIPYSSWLQFRSLVPAEDTINSNVNIFESDFTVTLKSRYLQEAYTMKILEGTYD